MDKHPFSPLIKTNLVTVVGRIALEAKAKLPDMCFVQNSLDIPVQTSALIIRSTCKINSELLDRLPQLKVITTCTSGFDHIDLQATQQKQVVVMYTPEANAASAAEHTWGLVLNCARNICEANQHIHAGKWTRDSFLGLELENKTYGIIGLGRIGSRVARIAGGFGMNVIGFDPFQDEQHFERAQVTRVSLEEALKCSDVISLHVPNSPSTFRMMNHSTFEYMNRGAILINTSRGEVIFEEALIKALHEGWLGSVGLDVFEKEPLPNQSKLLHYKNVIMTPHLGSMTEEAFRKSSLLGVDRTINFLETGTVTDQLPPLDAWYGAPCAKGFF